MHHLPRGSWDTKSTFSIQISAPGAEVGASEAQKCLKNHFIPKTTKERGIYLESSTEKGLEIVELDSVGGALDVRLKQEQNPACEEAAWDPGSSRESQIVL